MNRHVVITSTDVTPFSTTLATAEGEPIHGVKSVTVQMEAGKLTKATLEILAVFTSAAEAQFAVRDPATGQLKHVKRIEFADGTSFEVEE